MTVHSFHLLESSVRTTAKALLKPPTKSKVPGLHHAECMSMMELGSPVFSPSRMQFRKLAVFASWENEDAIDRFLADSSLGRELSTGWHVRLDFLRRWGHVTEFDGLPKSVGELDLDAPVVAVTLARLKLTQVPRFIRWGKPVERLVRDHPGTTLALAAMRPTNTVSTFSVWRTARDMTDMVHGHSSVDQADHHAVAMTERRRKDFHYEFTTLRFRALAEYGAWKGHGHRPPLRVTTVRRR